MKYFIILSAMVLVGYGMPAVDISNVEGWTDASVLISNGTSRVPFGQAGFATLHGGTFGGAGGAVWTVWDAFAFRDAISGNDRRIVYVRGRIDLTILFERSPGVELRVGSYKTIIGYGTTGLIHGGGLRIRSVHQVIIQNLRIHNALNYHPGETPDGNGGIQNMVSVDFSTIDFIGISNDAQNVWIDHCEFADDPWNAAVGWRRHDGQIDITRAASYISISNSIFRNHNLVSLIGNDDYMDADRGRLKTTFYLNWFQGTNQRNPRVRFGQVHLLNNYFSDITFYGVGAGTGAEIYAERNMFINVRRAWVLAFVIEPRGAVFDMNNWFHNSPPDNDVPFRVSWNPASVYHYTAMAAANVGDHVRRFAGPR